MLKGFVCLFFFLMHCTAGRISLALAPPHPQTAVEAWNPNRWTAWEIPTTDIYYLTVSVGQKSWQSIATFSASGSHEVVKVLFTSGDSSRGKKIWFQAHSGC